ncbi:MAG: [FeFe] hydrogenase, group A [Deltaproteobacteria bacterium]|jgi:NADH-quinone oxidoreductase subunit G|nr:[FeFe] hydrogenase, group A [Deltaproteobacteria bacterium]
MKAQSVTVDRLQVDMAGERNLLELVRKAGVELPTFCYHSEISVYGACRMCLVEVDGRGIVPACSTKPEDGMVVHTNTKDVREMRKMVVGLMLAAHDQSCTSCPKSGDCRLQYVARQLGVGETGLKPMKREGTLDTSSPSILRDPQKCVLCGDCVRTCDEIQSVGALGFINRGAKAIVGTSFMKGIGDIECVGCGQCVKVCPVGALTPKSEIDLVWKAIFDPKKKVVAQIAPAVRVAIGECFGKKPGALTVGRLVTALRRLGFDQVFDTAFGADFTVVEEAREFLARLKERRNLPLFTSCCPAWVKFAEQYYPDFLDNLSTCRSPQQMFGAITKDQLTADGSVAREDLVVVSIMPCTAKKFEARRDEFKVNGVPDVDLVLTTQELSQMVKEAGMDFNNLELGAFDLPYGFSTGASVIFGSSGGVSEAVLRYAAEALEKGTPKEFKQFRGNDNLVTSEITIGKDKLRLAVVSGLRNARDLIDRIRAGEVEFDLVEVMACVSGCVNGGGQPVSFDKEAVKGRSKGLYDNDRMLQFHVSSDNPYLQKIYSEHGEGYFHHLLHTAFLNRKRIDEEDFTLFAPGGDKALKLEICFGTSCYLRGAQDLYKRLMDHIRGKGLEDKIEFKASFCLQHCKNGPSLKVNGKLIEACTFEKAVSAIGESGVMGA